MCIICVQIMREKLTIQEALPGFEEAMKSHVTDDNVKHANEIIWAEKNGDTKKLNELVKAGYRKEKWL
jgi:hypothetical protein